MQVRPIEPSTTCAGSWPVRDEEGRGARWRSARCSPSSRPAIEPRRLLAVLASTRSRSSSSGDGEGPAPPASRRKPLAAPLVPVDRRRLLVDAVVARQANAGHAGFRFDGLRWPQMTRAMVTMFMPMASPESKRSGGRRSEPKAYGRTYRRRCRLVAASVRRWISSIWSVIHWTNHWVWTMPRCGRPGRGSSPRPRSAPRRRRLGGSPSSRGGGARHRGTLGRERHRVASATLPRTRSGPTMPMGSAPRR